METTAPQPATVLVVDDDPGFVDFMDEILQPEYRVRSALSGREALAQAKGDDPPGLILLDGLMPDMDGYEVCRRLKAEPPTRDIPVIFLTASRDARDEQRGLEMGAVDYIHKPATPSLMLQRIRLHLALRDQNLALEARVRERTRQLETEIAERRRAEAELQRLNGELQLAAKVFEECKESIVITDAGRNIVSVNASFTAITGYDESEVLGKNPRLLKSGRHDDAFFADMWAAIGRADYWMGEIWNRRKDGGVFPAVASISAIRDGSGALTHYVGILADISRQKMVEERLRYLTQYDALTGLANRDLLMDRLEQSIIAALRGGRRVSVVLLGIDRFKLVNDSLGHAAGDALLREIGDRLSGYLRPGDTVARLGGDQFILVLSDLAAEDDAAPLARGLLDVVSAPVEVAGQRMAVSASLGVAVCPKDGDSAPALLKNADAAMHRAKEMGRHCIQFYAPEMNARMLERLELETGLRRAIECQEFDLHYQPKVDLSSGHIFGAEALIRWRHPSAGMVSPGDFIPLAEETGLIVQIGEWVIETACAQLRSWHDEGFADLCLSVNLSARQFQQENLVDVVTQSLRVNDLQARHLDLEVTESAVMRDPEEAIGILRRLKEVGVRISLDDFGTGYSSLNYLKRLPVDILKLDQSFVREIVTSPEDMAIASSVISLAHSLKHRVVAEGIETRAQLGVLRRRGCDYMQGFYFSRPVPAEEFAQLLREGRALDIEAACGDGCNRTLLIVDDEENVMRALYRALRLEGYRILTAGSASEALDLLALNDVQVILSDQRMPEMGGIELLERAKEMYPDTMRLVLSGYTELKSITDAINRGAIYKFLSKPWDDHTLREHIREAFLLHETRRRSQPAPGMH